MAKSFSIPSFNATAKALRSALVSADRAASKAADAIAAAMCAYIDGAAAAGVPKSEEGCRALREEIKGCQTVVDMVASGLVSASTINAYSIGAARAFFHGEAWTARAFQATDKGGLPGLPWDSGNKAPKAKTVEKAAKTDKAAPLTVNGPASAEDARKFIAQQLETLHAYARKHGKVLDLQTRDVCEQLGRLADTLKKIDAKA